MKFSHAALFILGATFGASPAYAALSGFYDSTEQISTIFESHDVSNRLRQAPIGHIANTGTREDGAKEWEIRTQDCDLKVYLTATPPKGPGKTTYAIADIGNCE
ncbi:hypothetical protein MIC97_07600 [Aquamicrobium sp. NLF2-7]|uniref:hypothetical protein n=1 Tax=Aquamicrobium TaxID=69278 RepID=UPI001EFC100A|nr:MULTISPECIES: hypothetical protein [Aquamicrobium]MCG8271376.1 hypothetical protein [Aquamicrobium sp. NLF2-7]MDH4991032.1 hypothetical protein [Aquamicrobium lusatiense]